MRQIAAHVLSLSMFLDGQGMDFSYLVLDNILSAVYDSSVKLNERNIFLVDGVGATLSAFSTGIVLPFFSTWIRLPVWSLHSLGLLGLSFAVYSFGCYCLIRRIKPLMLLGIISANSLYSIVAFTIALAFKELTQLGQAYFIIEAFIVLGVVFVEVKVYRKSFMLTTTSELR